METHVSEVQTSLQRTMELVKEIALLELEVMHLERHLLSLYEKVFDRRQESLSNDSKEINQIEVTRNKHLSSRGSSDCVQMSEDHVSDIVPIAEYDGAQEILGASIHRCHSSLSHHSAYAMIQSSPLMGQVADAVQSYHSLPLTMLENATGEVSSYVINCNASQFRQTANMLSEDMVRCMSSIFCKLAAHSIISNDFSSPAVSFGSPGTEFYPWSPQSKMNSSLDLYSDLSFHGGCEEFSGPYCEMVEVLQIYRDSAKLREIDPMLQKFRSLVNKLEDVSPANLKHDEKLAFWINVHNALVMHAFLVYGVEQIKRNRGSFLLKAAYRIGGQTVSVAMMQNYIFGSRLPYLGQLYRWLFNRNKKYKTRDKSECYATDHAEPLAYFALCCGRHSDPPVRVYTPKRVFNELIAARGDYIMYNYKVNRELNKLLMPKIVESYVKDSGLHPADLMGIMEQILPADLLRNKTSQHWFRKGWKGIGWIPHNYSFRYQFPKDLLC